MKLPYGKILEQNDVPFSTLAKAFATCMVSLFFTDGETEFLLECPHCGGRFLKVVNIEKTNVVKCKHCKEKFLIE